MHECVNGCSFCLLFFFKQKTAYELRISDWSSDVCSSDLRGVAVAGGAGGQLVELIAQDGALRLLVVVSAARHSGDQCHEAEGNGGSRPVHRSGVLDRKSVV